MSTEITIAVLLISGLALMVLEAFVPTFGILGIAGAAAFYAALFMMRHLGSFYGFEVDVPIIAALGIVGIAVLGLSFYYTRLAQTKTLSAGAEILPGMKGRVLNWSGTSGNVHVDGERWAAQGPADLQPGDIIVVSARNNLTLTVTEET